MNPVSPDFDALDEQHRTEELSDAQRTLRRFPRPMRVVLPAGGLLPRSTEWLERLHAGDRVPREKKPMVIDHLRSAGPFMVSIDDSPMSVIDGMSQTATFPDGFANGAVVRRYTEGGFGRTLLETGAVDRAAASSFAGALRGALGVSQITFANSGAEANEKAFALCHARHPKRRRVLAFEGSFHGRTLLALQASYNPSKRAPYEIPGYEVAYAPYPLWPTPEMGEPESPEGWLGAVHAGAWPGVEDTSELLTSELRSLRAVDLELAKGDVFAVILEPMQSEGGDRYTTARFHRAVRVLTRRHDVPLIYDEVQTGFGLGGELVWHARFGLTKVDGEPDRPDVITFAKRAQVGVVASDWQDPDPTSVHGASALRGLTHLQAIDPVDARHVEAQVRDHLQRLAARFPDLVRCPRATGYAMAFDLPEPRHLQAYLKQRFWRGVVVFGAGDRTVRQRLGRAFRARDIDRLFDAVRGTLKWLEANPELPATAWQDAHPSPREAVKPKRDATLRVRTVDPEEADVFLDAFMAIETKVYEPARRDTRDWLGKAFDGPASVAVAVEAEVDGTWTLVGATLGCPLEHVSGPDGVDADPMRPRNNTMYALSTALDPDWSGFGLGKRMKLALVDEAARLKRPDGAPRYHFMSGRMRLGATVAMQRINESLGATEVFRFEGQYGGEAAATYYRMPLRAPIVIDVVGASCSDPARPLELSDVSAPLDEPPATLAQLHRRGALYGPAVNKVTLVNYVSPAVVRAVEHISALTPGHPHLFLTSSRDETFDKSLRILKHHRPKATIALGFEGGYVGHTTAAARSLSDPAVHRGGPRYFDEFVLLPHPSEGVDAARAALGEFAGRDDVLGLWVEPMQERTGRLVPDEFYSSALGLPLVGVETTGAYYRSGDGPFMSMGGTNMSADLRIWFGGGQIGFVHTSADYYVAKPLTMVSTWDGDELSLIRCHHRLRTLRELADARGDELERLLADALAPLRERGVRIEGRGAFRVAHLGDAAEPLCERLQAEGFRVIAYPNGAVAFAPPMDARPQRLDALADALR